MVYRFQLGAYELQMATSNQELLMAAISNAQASDYVLPSGVLINRGSFDASGNTFPSSGGSGTGGQILNGNLWVIGVSGTLGGVDVFPGTEVMALVDSPADDINDWKINFG